MNNQLLKLIFSMLYICWVFHLITVYSNNHGETGTHSTENGYYHLFFEQRYLILSTCLILTLDIIWNDWSDYPRVVMEHRSPQRCLGPGVVVMPDTIHLEILWCFISVGWWIQNLVDCCPTLHVCWGVVAPIVPIEFSLVLVFILSPGLLRHRYD